jgi:hypothetical protein
LIPALARGFILGEGEFLCGMFRSGFRDFVCRFVCHLTACSA